jgi:hypothetical protein
MHGSEAKLLLRAVTVQSRGLYLGHVADAFYGGDVPNAMRGTRELIERGHLRTVKCFVRPSPEFAEPLLTNVRGVPRRSVGEAAYFNGRRWAESPVRVVSALVASQMAGRLFGVRRTGQLLKNLQGSHDLALGALLLHYLRTDPLACHWYGEDWVSENVPGVRAEGEKLPDAFLLEGGRVLRVIELAGAEYDKARLLAFCRWAENKGYEFQVF